MIIKASTVNLYGRTLRMKDAPLGTPENPEIIDPREPRGPRPEAKGPRNPGRFGVLSQLVMTMLKLALPALVLDVACYALFKSAFGGNALAWIPLIFMVPVAGLLTLISILINAFLLVALLFVLAGKPVSMPQGGAPFFRFVRFPGSR